MKTDGSDQNTKGAGNGNGAAENTQERARKTLQWQITGMAREFERALPGKIGVERMMRISMTAILKTPLLAQCEPTTFFGSLLQALQLGLEVNTPLGQAYLIPRKKYDKNGNFLYWECTFQLGYQGLLDLCYRYGKYKRITAEVVYEGDYFEYRYGTSQMLTHIPEGKSEKPTHVWALYELENGGERFTVWTWNEAMKHAEDFSDAYKSGKKDTPWRKNDTTQEEMAKKSVLKALLKYAPKSVEVATAAYADERAVVADKYEEAGETRLRFDVKELPEPDQEAKDFMAKVNGAKPKAEKEPVPARAESAPPKAQAAETARKPEPETAAGAKPNAGGMHSVPFVSPPNSPAETPSTNRASGLFGKDEESALEEQYEREQMARADGPDFT